MLQILTEPYPLYYMEVLGGYGVRWANIELDSPHTVHRHWACPKQQPNLTWRSSEAWTTTKFWLTVKCQQLRQTTLRAWPNESSPNNESTPLALIFIVFLQVQSRRCNIVDRQVKLGKTVWKFSDVEKLLKIGWIWIWLIDKLLEDMMNILQSIDLDDLISAKKIWQKQIEGYSFHWNDWHWQLT